MTAKTIYETMHYTVEESDSRSIIGEDGKYTTSHPGYVVINRQTGVIEHSTTMLPGAIFQCQHFNDSLESLLNPVEDDDQPDITNLNVPEDIVPN